MDESGSAAANSAMAQQHQKLIIQQQRQQQQMLLLHQLQQQQQQHQHQQFQIHHQQQQQQIQQQQQQHQQQIQQQQQQQQQQQHIQQLQQQLQQQQHLQHLQQQAQAISRFPSNIDAHLRSPGVRSLHLQQQQQQQQPIVQQQQQTPPPKGLGVGVGVGRQGNHVELEMAYLDARKVCNPDIKRPFSGIEDAVERLLPYHVVADFEAEEDDRILDSDTTGQIPSRLQQWDHNILNKLAEFSSTFEKQVLAFNIMSRKRALGEFRSEERLMIEQALLQEEKLALLQLRSEIESREKAGREAVEAMRMALAQAEQARAEASSHPDMIGHAPMRAGDGLGFEIGQDQGGNADDDAHLWNGNMTREEAEPSDDYLNDGNDHENGETGLQSEWRGAGELDLNAR